MSALLVFDADNTLWDTHALFVAARRELLRVLGESGLLRTDEDYAAALLSIDRELSQKAGATEYEYHHLAAAAVLCFGEGLTAQEAASQASGACGRMPDRLQQAVERAYLAFANALRQPPPFYPDAAPVLSLLRDAGGVTMVVFSEGAPDRVSGTLDAFPVRFDQVVIQKKTTEAWRAVKEAGHRLGKAAYGTEPAVSVMVGDSIQRDIKPGNQAGFVTVYRPGGYFGRETPASRIEQPHHRIDSLRELPAILTSLGLRISA